MVRLRSHDKRPAIVALHNRRHALCRLEQEPSRWGRAITLVSESEVKLFRRFCYLGLSR